MSCWFPEHLYLISRSPTTIEKTICYLFSDDPSKPPTYLSTEVRLIKPSYFLASLWSLSNFLSLRASPYNSPILSPSLLASPSCLSLSFASLSACLSCIWEADSRNLSWTRLATRSRCRSFSRSSSRLDLAFWRCRKKRLPRRLAWWDYYCFWFCLARAFVSDRRCATTAEAFVAGFKLIMSLEPEGEHSCWSILATPACCWELVLGNGCC